MRQKKFGASAFFRNTLVRRHLFFSTAKSLSLEECIEFQNGRCFGKYWEVVLVTPSPDKFRLERKTVLRTEVYGIAWDMVKDPLHDERRVK